MTRNMWTWLVSAVTITAVTLGGAWSARAQQPATTTEKIKSKLGSAADSIKKGAISAEEAIKEKFAQAKGAVTKMEIEARVYARLHWDKNLAAAKIDLGAPKQGAISLNGTVPDAKAKAKAIELTTDTVGVTEVIDNLTVSSIGTVK